MNSALHFLGIVFAALAVAGVAITFAAAIAMTRFPRRLEARAAVSEPVTILKPLKGVQPGLEECLASALVQVYGAPVQIVFGVADPNDPSVAVARKLIADHPNCDSEIVIDGATHGANRKVSNLMNMMAAAKHDVLVISDSDIRVPPDWLLTILQELEQPGVGAVTCLYSAIAQTGVWSKLSALGISCQFLPNAVFGSATGMAHPCTGATIALRRQTLDSIGGMVRFADKLADDYEIGRAVRANGLSVAVSALIVEHVCTESTFNEWWQHELRWARTIRMIDPAGYAGSILTQPIPLAVLVLLLLGVAIFTITTLGMAILSRLFLTLATDRRVKKRARPLWLLPLRDILWFGVFVVSFFGTGVRWREGKLYAQQARQL